MGAMLWRSVSTTNIFKLYFRNTLAFTGGFEISVDNLILLQSLGVHYVGGEFFAQNVLPTICALSPGLICDALAATGTIEPISV